MCVSCMCVSSGITKAMANAAKIRYQVEYEQKLAALQADFDKQTAEYERKVKELKEECHTKIATLWQRYNAAVKNSEQFQRFWEEGK